MKQMTMLTVAMLVCSVVAGCAVAEDKESGKAEGNWLTDFAQAKTLAAEQKRPIFINFSGSDWCGWCVKLDGEVFSQEAFVKYAGENLVLLLADFPKRTKLPEAIAAQNNKLAENYGIRGFPTVLLVDAEGKVLAQTGYQRGGADAYVEHLKGLLKQ
jgi:protein disulfide-isomerase